MALTEGDKAICMEIAREIIEKSLQLHVENCPIDRRAELARNKIVSNLAISKAKLLGIAAGIAIGSGLGGGTIVTVFIKLLGWI